MTVAKIGDTVVLSSLEGKTGKRTEPDVFRERARGVVHDARNSMTGLPMVMLKGTATWWYLDAFDKVEIIDDDIDLDAPLPDQQALLATILHGLSCGCTDWAPGDVEDPEWDEMAITIIASGFNATLSSRNIATLGQLAAELPADSK